MVSKTINHKTLHEKITGREPNEFLLQQINKTPDKLNQILSTQKNLEIENKRLKSQLEKGLESKEDTPLEETLKAFEKWFTKSNDFGSIMEDFYLWSKELLEKDFYSIRGLIEFVAKSKHQEIFIHKFLGEKLNDFSENTQLAILYIIGSNNYGLIDEHVMDRFYIYFSPKTTSEKVANYLITRENKLAREFIMYNKLLKKEFMLNEILMRLMDDKDDRIRMLARKARDELLG